MTNEELVSVINLYKVNILDVVNDVLGTSARTDIPDNLINELVIKALRKTSSDYKVSRLVNNYVKYKIFKDRLQGREKN